MGRADASALLCRLLAAPDLPYRWRWTALGSAPRRGHALNLSAVGRVVAEHLVDTDRLDEVAEAGWSRRHKDWLRRDLNPNLPEDRHPLDRDALGLFCDAFAISESHRHELLATWASAPQALLLHRPREVGDPEVRRAPLPPPSGYHAASVLEEHHIGATGDPWLHRTSMLVTADVDDLRSIVYVFAPQGVLGMVERGGAGLGPVRAVGPGLWGQDIQLDPPLARGQQQLVVHSTHYRHTARLRPEFRRAALSRPDAPIEIHVRFDAAHLPARVTRCMWNDATGPPIAEAPTGVDADHAVRLQITYLVPGVLVGFRWEWPEQA